MEKPSIMTAFGSWKPTKPIVNVREIRDAVREQVIAEKYGNHLVEGK